MSLDAPEGLRRGAPPRPFSYASRRRPPYQMQGADAARALSARFHGLATAAALARPGGRRAGEAPAAAGTARIVARRAAAGRVQAPGDHLGGVKLAIRP